MPTIGKKIDAAAVCIGISTNYAGVKTYDYRVGRFQVQTDAAGIIKSYFGNPNWLDG